MRRSFWPILWSCFCVMLPLFPECHTVAASTWFVATNGLDTKTGTSNSPFATINRAQTAAGGDTVFLRGGTYSLSNANLTVTNNSWAIVNNITKSGISYVASPGEQPIIDFTPALSTLNQHPKGAAKVFGMSEGL